MQDAPYTNSTAFKINPTYCCVCSKPLVDADSVNMGIGPVCRKSLA